MTRPTQLASLLLVAAALTLAACRSAPPAETVAAENVAAETGAVATAKAGTPKITADEAVYEFGAIGITDSIEHVFKIRNTGDAELKIERVQKT